SRCVQGFCCLPRLHPLLASMALPVGSRSHRVEPLTQLTGAPKGAWDCPKVEQRDRPHCTGQREDGSETPSLENVTCASEEQVVDARDFLRVVTTGLRRGSDDAIGAGK